MKATINRRRRRRAGSIIWFEGKGGEGGGEGQEDVDIWYSLLFLSSIF